MKERTRNFTAGGSRRQSTRHPLSERYRLALSLSTANDLFGLARYKESTAAYQLFIAVAILLFEQF